MTAKNRSLPSAVAERCLPATSNQSDDFTFVMSPHRSLSDRAFAGFIVAILSVAFLAQIFFVVIGVWVAGAAALFNGLFLAAAFGACRSDRKKLETLFYRDGFLVSIRRRGNGEVISTAELPTFGLTLHRLTDPDYGCRKLLVSSLEKTVEIASELSPSERQSLGDALVDALRSRGFPPNLRETSTTSDHSTAKLDR